MSWKVLLVFFFVNCVLGMDLPNWETIQENLHAKIEDIYNDRDEVYKTIDVGKYFKYYVPGDGDYMAVEEGGNLLPSWLTFDRSKNKLHGIPTEHDMRMGLRISFNSIDKRNKKKLILNIVKRTNNFGCPEALTLASVVFHANLNKMSSHERVEFLRNFAHHFDASINDMYVEHGNRMDNLGMLTSNNIRRAGPGDNPDKIVGNEPGFTVSWKLLCGYNVEDHPDIGVLRTFTSQADFSQLNKPVLGWLITSTKVNRNRRAIGAGATPFATPSASIQGTPTLVPSASIDVKPSAKIQITPTKSMRMTRTSSVVPPVVVTDPPTTTTTTTTTTTSTTTEETTQKPTVTTTEETTTKTTTTTTTTEKSTQPPTTKQSTANRKPEVDPDHKFKFIAAREQQATIYNVPIGLFRDDDLISTSLLYKKNVYVEEVPDWITYKEKGRAIYILPTARDTGDHEFALKVKDSGGLVAQHFFKVIVKKDQVAYDMQFNMTLDMDYDSVASNVYEKVILIAHIAKALGYSNGGRFRNIKFMEGSVIILWSDWQFANASSCNHPELISIVQRLNDVGQMAEKMLPYTLVSTGKLSASGCTAIKQSPSESKESLLEHILIPVIVIVIVLLVIVLILCCVYRRKKKYEPTPQDEIYLNQKKPVIFLEEYEEKPDFLSLKPLVLPNEKPPTEGYAPRGGSPDGPESSTTASTEDDENAPLAPKSPKDNRSGFNAPPPYSAR